MRKIAVFLVVGILFLFSSCAKEPIPVESLPTGINPLNTSESSNYGQLSAIGKPLPEGTISRKRLNSPHTLGYDVYNGEPIEVSLEVLASETPTYTEGYMVFVEGIPVLSRIKVDGVMHEKEKYMHIVDHREGTTTNVNLYFEPLGFQKGEIVEFYIAYIFTPSYIPYEYYPLYGNTHKIMNAPSSPVKIEKGSDSTTKEMALFPSRTYEIPNEIYKMYEHEDGTNYLDSDPIVELYDSSGSQIVQQMGANGYTDLKIKLYGGNSTQYRLTLLIDQQPVLVSGKDYLEVTLEKGTTAEFDFTIDISELDRKSTIMTVAVPYGDTFQRYITHSVPVLLINLDKLQAEEDIVSPEYKYAE